MRPPNELFRFRFISRGDTANRLTRLAARALQWCHPGALVTIVDANDEPRLETAEFPSADIVHIVPCDDAVSARVGRGSRKHMFYWRHSPEVLMKIPSDTEFTAYMDSDIMVMRPMDLESIVEPLRRGRIGISVDESMSTYAHLLQERADVMSSILDVPGGGGPLLQGGLIFSHKVDDGDLYGHFWRLAEIAAAEDLLDLLPFDDMALLTALVTQGGRLWERWLPLGHEWNCMSAAGQDHGVFAIGAHYGGFRAKARVLDEAWQFTRPDGCNDGWGTSAGKLVDGRWRFLRGMISGTPAAGFVHHYLTPPFAISFIAPANTSSVTIQARARYGHLGSILAYVDGRCCFRHDTKRQGPLHHELDLENGRVITIIVAPHDRANNEVIELRIGFVHGDRVGPGNSGLPCARCDSTRTRVSSKEP
jgi:hypothetical protein